MWPPTFLTSSHCCPGMRCQFPLAVRPSAQWHGLYSTAGTFIESASGRHWETGLPPIPIHLLGQTHRLPPPTPQLHTRRSRTCASSHVLPPTPADTHTPQDLHSWAAIVQDRRCEPRALPLPGAQPMEPREWPAGTPWLHSWPAVISQPQLTSAQENA